METSNGTTYECKYLIACDGSRSFIRNKYKIPCSTVESLEEKQLKYPQEQLVFSILINCTDPKVQEVLDKVVDELVAAL